MIFFFILTDTGMWGTGARGVERGKLTFNVRCWDGERRWVAQQHLRDRPHCHLKMLDYVLSKAKATVR
jgi:hypothetical protein